uniref:Uncharacterized protein n=1 Tax=Anguilla anguilla TaxID=7936 RepID=A0A0E9Q815_ANGAN
MVMPQVLAHLSSLMM